MNNDDNFKKDINPPSHAAELEARVVAWVLGEASAFEAAELERLCAEQPELAVFKRRIEAVHGLVGEAAKPMKEPLRLSPERRAKVRAVIGGAATAEPTIAGPVKARKKARSWRSWALPMAACVTMMVLLAAVMIPTLGKVQQSSRKAAAFADRRQAEQLRSMEAPLISQEVVDARTIHDAERRGGGRAPGESDQMAATQSLSALRASGSDASFSDRTMVSSGLLATDASPAATAAPASQPVPGTFRSREVGGVADTTLGDSAVRPPRSFGVPQNQSSEEFSAGFGATGKVTEAAPEPARKRNTITITAGTPQEFTVREMTESESLDTQRPLRDQGKSFAFDADKSRGKQDGYAGYADNFDNRRLESVAAEVRRRQRLRPDADPFAAPSVGGLGTGYASLLGNKDAEGSLDRLAKAKNAEDELKQSNAHGQKIEEVSRSGQRPGGNVDQKKTKEAQQAELLARLDQVVIPKVEFRGVDLGRALSALTAVSEEAGGPQSIRGVNIRLEDSGNPPPAVSVTLRGLSLRRVLDLITDSVGYRYEIQGNVIVVRPTDPKPSIEPQDLDKKLRAEIPTATEAVSTFSLHVSDASFRLAKAALARGEAPDSATIRPEEFYNAFDYGDPAPVAGEPVACRIEQAAHPFLQQRNLVRIAMKVPAAGRGAGTPLRLTVLLDTSGSMEREDRAATVRAAFTSLASLLGPNDRVTLIGFARTPRLLAESVAGNEAGKLIELAERTPAEGGTNMEEALALAGKLAMRQKLAGAQNRIVLLTDGAANLGDADPQQLAKRVESLRQNGIAFDACGVVADGLDDTVLEALTRKGDGRYSILNSPEEADAVFARKLAGAFRPAAKDVKVQVRFNPARVARYRLIGFEQHRLKTEDFRNDAVDAAELAAEEAAVAVYQVEVRPEGEGELGEVSVRFLDTRSNERVERSWTLAYAAQPAAFARATPSLQLAGSAAFLAEKLRGGALAGQVRMNEFGSVVEGLGAAYPNAPRVRDFIEMFRQARRLTGE